MRFFVVTAFSFIILNSAHSEERLNTEAASLNIIWYGLVSHESLIDWPPKPHKIEHAKTIETKLLQAIKLKDPRASIRLPRPDQDLLKRARNEVRQATVRYNMLEHQQTIVKLQNALQLFSSADYHLFEREETSSIYLLLGKTKLEQNDATEAMQYIRRAYEFDPSLTIDETTEHPDTVELMVESRRSFLQRPPERPQMNFGSVNKANTVRIFGRIFQRRLELLIIAPTGQRLEVESLHTDLDSALSRIVSRFLDCTPRRAQVSTESLDAQKFNWGLGGVGVATPLESPIGNVPMLSAYFSVVQELSKHSEFISGGRINYSEQDTKAHLRSRNTQFQIFAGPRPKIKLNRMTLYAHLLPWISHRSKLELTTNPACKFFQPEDLPPAQLCDFERDVRKIPAGWEGGLELGAGIQYSITKKVRLFSETTLQQRLIEQEQSPFDQHLYLTLGLSYRL